VNFQKLILLFLTLLLIGIRHSTSVAKVNFDMPSSGDPCTNLLVSISQEPANLQQLHATLYQSARAGRAISQHPFIRRQVGLMLGEALRLSQSLDSINLRLASLKVLRQKLDRAIADFRSPLTEDELWAASRNFAVVAEAIDRSVEDFDEYGQLTDEVVNSYLGMAQSRRRSSGYYETAKQKRDELNPILGEAHGFVVVPYAEELDERQITLLMAHGILPQYILLKPEVVIDGSRVRRAQALYLYERHSADHLHAIQALLADESLNPLSPRQRIERLRDSVVTLDQRIGLVPDSVFRYQLYWVLFHKLHETYDVELFVKGFSSTEQLSSTIEEDFRLLGRRNMVSIVTGYGQPWSAAEVQFKSYLRELNF